MIGIGVLLGYFSFSVSDRQIEQIADEVIAVVTEDVSLPSQQQIATSSFYKVLSVTDGQDETVRVLGINTPETAYAKKGAECFGTEASTYAKQFLQGSRVALKQDPSQDSRDTYGRLLAYVILADGRDFGNMMIENGYAYEYTFKGRGYQKQMLYRNAERDAQEKGIGLWAVCTP